MQHYTTPNKRRWTNKKIFIILHHTTSKNFYGTVSWFKNPKSEASAHYLVWMNWELGQFENDNTVLWHAGESKRTTADWNTFYDINNYSIWIEISNDGERFTDIQRKNVRKIINDLMQKYGIWPENILRHKDISWYRGKVDPYDTFRNNQYKTFTDYQNSFNSLLDQMDKIKQLQHDYKRNSSDYDFASDVVEFIEDDKLKRLYETKRELAEKINARMRKLGIAPK